MKLIKGTIWGEARQKKWLQILVRFIPTLFLCETHKAKYETVSADGCSWVAVSAGCYQTGGAQESQVTLAGLNFPENLHS